jgi:hypothetical protein
MWKLRLITLSMACGGALPVLGGCLSDQQATNILTSVISTSLSALAGGIVESFFATLNSGAV